MVTTAKTPDYLGNAGLGLTQAELATRLGVPMRTISDNERGASVAGGRVLAAYCELGIRADWLLTGSGRPFSVDASLEIRDMVEAADDGQIALAHFERNDIRPSYLVESDKRRYLSRISISQDLAVLLCGSTDLGLPSAFRLFTITDGPDVLLVIDGRIRNVSKDGVYLVLEDQRLARREIQVLRNAQVAIKSSNDPSRVECIANTKKIETFGRVVGKVSAC